MLKFKKRIYFKIIISLITTYLILHKFIYIEILVPQLGQMFSINFIWYFIFLLPIFIVCIWIGIQIKDIKELIYCSILGAVITITYILGCAFFGVRPFLNYYDDTSVIVGVGVVQFLFSVPLFIFLYGIPLVAGFFLRKKREE
ncbi:hypothetical protein K1X76_11350 [bacterium]|nr:hypothetical protein [bacterium]